MEQQTTRPLGDYPSYVIPDGKYKGMIYVQNVDTFVENTRTFNMPSGEKRTIRFTPEWCSQAIDNHQFKFQTDGYLAPSHIGHNEKGGPEQDGAGLFLPNRIETIQYQGKPKMFVFSDLIMPPDVWEQAKNLKLPYRSVEIDDPKVPMFSSLALLRSRPPFMETQPFVPYMAFGKSGHIFCYSAAIPLKFNGDMMEDVSKSKYNKECYSIAKQHFNLDDPNEEELKFISSVLSFGGPGSGRKPNDGTPSSKDKKIIEKMTSLDNSLRKAKSSGDNDLAKAIQDEMDRASLGFGGPGSGPQKGYGDTLNRTKGENLDGTFIDKMARALHSIGNPLTIPGRIGASLIERTSRGINDQDSAWENEMEKQGKFSKKRLNLPFAKDAGNGASDKAKELAQKLSKNWWQIKGKLAASPEFNWLINKINQNMNNLDPKNPQSGHQGGEVNISADVLASWLQSVPGMVGKLSQFFSSEGNNDMPNAQYTKPMDPVTRGKRTKEKLQKIEAQIPELEKLIQEYKSRETDKSMPADLPNAQRRLSRRQARAEELKARIAELRRYVRALREEKRGQVGFDGESEEMEEKEGSMNFDESDQIESKIEQLLKEAQSADFSAEDGEEESEEEMNYEGETGSESLDAEDEEEMPEEEMDFADEESLDAEEETATLSETAKQSIIDTLTSEGFSMEQATSMVDKLLEGVGFSGEDGKEESQEADPEIEPFQKSTKQPLTFTAKDNEMKDQNKALSSELARISAENEKNSKKIAQMEEEKEVGIAIKYAQSLSEGYNFTSLIQSEVPSRFKEAGRGKKGKEAVKKMVDTWKNAIQMHHPVDLDSVHFVGASSSDEQDKLDFIAKYPQYSEDIEQMAREFKKAKKENPSYHYTMKEHIDFNLYPLIRG